MTITLSPGQDADISHGPELLADHRPEKVLADKGYDSDAFVKAIEDKGAEAVIPPKKNRKTPRDHDKDVRKERNKVERTVGLLKQCRRVATRCEKTARNFLGIVLFAAINLWLEEMVAEVDTVAARFVMRGTHNGTFFGVPPTGKKISVQAMNFYRLADGKIVEERGQPDLLGLLRQIGAVKMA